MRLELTSTCVGRQSPEVYGDERMPYGPEVDMWSFGVTLGMLLAHRGRRPWWTSGTCHLDIVGELKAALLERRERKATVADQHKWDAAEDLMVALLKYWGEERLTAEEVLQHPFVASVQEVIIVSVCTSVRR